MFRNYRDCVRTPQDDSSSSNQCNSVGYACDICPESSDKYITETDVELHRKKDHQQVIENLRLQHRERFCGVCMKLQPNYSSLITHLKTEHLLSSPTAKRVEREIYICDHCNNIFFNKEVLEIHIQFRHLYGIEERRSKYFKCPQCSKHSSLINVWFHFQKHNIPSVSVCDICTLSLSNREQLHEHLKSHPYLYRCDTCSYTTHKESLFNLHLGKHESRVVSSKRKVDRSIKKLFRNTRFLGALIPRFNIHNLLKGLNLPSTIRICILCREICTDKIDMRTHVLRDHFYKEPVSKVKYVCACGEEFSNKILVKQHVFKLKGMHRILGDNESPETLNNEAVMEDTLQETYEDDQTIFVIETLDGASLQSIMNTNNVIVAIDGPTDADKQTTTDNHTISTNKEAENTDVTVTRLTDGHTDNNIIINTENLAESGVIVITRMGDEETGINDQIITSDGQIVTSSGQVITSDGQIMTNYGQITTNDGQVITNVGQVMTDDGQVIPSDGQVITSDGQVITSDGQIMISDGQVMTNEDQVMTSDSQVMTSDGQK